MNKRITAIALSLLMVLTVLASIVPASAYTTAGPVEIRGTVATGDGTWDASTFAGFYYNINDNIGTETLTIVEPGLDGDNRFIEKDLITYTTTPEPTDFEWAAFGEYQVIGFMAEPYFTAYLATTEFADDLEDINLLSGEDLSKVLIDSDDKYTIATGDGLELKEGYVLNVQQVDLDGSKALFELTKDGKVVDTQVVYPDDNNLYVYDELTLGDEADTPTIIARIDSVFRGTDTNVVSIEGLFQISDTVTSVEQGDKFGNMEITNVGPGGITARNVDDSITLSIDSVKPLFGAVSFKVADSEELRFYPMVEVTIEGENGTSTTTTTTTTPVVNETATTTPVVNETATTTPVVNETATTTTTPVVNETAAEEEPADKVPGFEAVFAVTGLLAVAFFVLRQRE